MGEGPRLRSLKAEASGLREASIGAAVYTLATYLPDKSPEKKTILAAAERLYREGKDTLSAGTTPEAPAPKKKRTTR